LLLVQVPPVAKGLPLPEQIAGKRLRTPRSPMELFDRTGDGNVGRPQTQLGFPFERPRDGGLVLRMTQQPYVVARRRRPDPGPTGARLRAVFGAAGIGAHEHLHPGSITPYGGRKSNHTGGGRGTKMRILQVHTPYRDVGGEDVVVR